MIFKLNTASYNDRRYGKPWIARLDFTASNSKPEYRWGEWCGRPGEAGELSIEVEIGDVIAQGQKDIRKNRGGADDTGVVQPDGSVQWGYTLAKARDDGRILREQAVELPNV